MLFKKTKSEIGHSNLFDEFKQETVAVSDELVFCD